MKKIYLSYIKFIYYIQSVRSIYEIMLLVVTAFSLLLLSFVTHSPSVEKWSSVFSGFTFGIILLKFPGIIAYFKRVSNKSF